MQQQYVTYQEKESSAPIVFNHAVMVMHRKSKCEMRLTLSGNKNERTIIEKLKTKGGHTDDDYDRWKWWPWSPCWWKTKITPTTPNNSELIKFIHAIKVKKTNTHSYTKITSENGALQLHYTTISILPLQISSLASFVCFPTRTLHATVLAKILHMWPHSHLVGSHTMSPNILYWYWCFSLSRCLYLCNMTMETKQCDSPIMRTMCLWFNFFITSASSISSDCTHTERCVLQFN